MLTEADYTLHERKFAAAMIAYGKAHGASPAECAERTMIAFELNGLRDPLPLLWHWLLPPELQEESPQPQPEFDRRARH